MPDHKWWADALDAIGNHDAAEQMRGAMPDTDLAAVVARVRNEYPEYAGFPETPYVRSLCDAVERLTADLEAWRDMFGFDDPQDAYAEHGRWLKRNSADRDRLRQIIADLLAKCPTCSRVPQWRGSLTCPNCGPARKAMEAT